MTRSLLLAAVLLSTSVASAEPRLLTGPSDKVTGVAWSPDGSQLASTGADRFVRVYDGENGVIKQWMEGLTGKARALAWSPDGLAIVATDDAGAILGWKPDGTALWGVHLTTHVFATSLAFAPDGKNFVAGCSDSTLRYFDAHTGKAGRVLKAGKSAVSSVSWSHDGKFLASADPSVRLWAAETGKMLRVADVPPQKPTIVSLAFAPDSRVLAGGTSGGQMEFWTVLDGKGLAQIDAHIDRVNALSYSNSGERLVSGSTDGRVRLWDMNTGKVSNEFTGHKEAVGAVDITRDGTRIASGGDDGSVRVWSSNSGEQRLRIAGPRGTVVGLAQIPGQKTVVTLTKAGEIAAWDLSTGTGRWQRHAHEPPTSALVVTPDARYIVTAGGLQTAGEPDAEGHFAPGSATRAEVKIWDPSIGVSVRDLGAHPGLISALALSGDGRTLISAADLGKKGDILVWDMAASATKARVGGEIPPIRALAYSSGTALFASGGSEGTVQLIDPRNTVTQQTIHLASSVEALALSADGATVATGSEAKDGSSVVQLWDVHSGKLVRAFSGQQGKVTQLTFSPDGWYLLSTSAGPKGDAHLWIVQTGEAGAIAAGATVGGFTAAAFAPDVHNVVIAAADGSLRLWAAH